MNDYFCENIVTINLVVIFRHYRDDDHRRDARHFISVELNEIPSDLEICTKIIFQLTGFGHKLSLRTVCWQNKPCTYFRIRPNVFQVHFVKTCYRSNEKSGIGWVFPVAIWSGKTHPNLFLLILAFVYDQCASHRSTMHGQFQRM